MDVKSGGADTKGWHGKLASVSAPFVSLLAPVSRTANLTTWLADKQLIDYGTAGNGLVYRGLLKDDSNFCFSSHCFNITSYVKYKLGVQLMPLFTYK